MVKQTRPGRGRLLLGAAIGLSLLAITLSQVDVAGAARIIGSASPGLLGLALGIVLVDLIIRAMRWYFLLRGVRPSRPGSFRLAAAYLTVGYLANQLLPVRLGDLARAYLAGRAFHMSRLAALGTIVVERVADGVTMLTLALVSSLLISGVAAVQQLALYGLVLGLLALSGLTMGWWLLLRKRLGRFRPVVFLRDLGVRVWAGMSAMLSVRGAIVVLAASAAAATTAVSIGWVVTASTGMTLTPIHAVLFVSAVALSLAIPAAPAAIGTYELVGVVVLTSFGYTGEQALAAVVLMRLVTTLPPVLLGILSAWVLHLRAGVLLDPERVAGTFGAPQGASS